MAQIFGDSKTRLAKPPAPADPALSRGLGSGGLQLVPSSSPAPALRRGDISSQAVSKFPLQSHMAHVKRLPRVKTQPRLLCAVLIFKKGQSPSLGGRRGRGCSAAPLCWRRGEAETAESGWSQLDLVSPICFLAREAQPIRRASASQGEKKRLGSRAVAQGSPPGTASFRLICTRTFFWQGTGASRCPAPGHLLKRRQRQWSGLLALNCEPSALRACRAVAQHTSAAPNIWHRRAAASEGRQHPTTMGQPCPRGSGLHFPSSPQQEMGKQQNNNNNNTTNNKKKCKRPSTLSCSTRTPKRTRCLESEGRWRHKDFPANAGSRLYCTLHHI